MDSPNNVVALVKEYRVLLSERRSQDLQAIQADLVRSGDWTPRAAEHLVSLAKSYGSFMLRNALAISLVLGIEDGDLDF